MPLAVIRVKVKSLGGGRLGAGLETHTTQIRSQEQVLNKMKGKPAVTSFGLICTRFDPFPLIYGLKKMIFSISLL